MEAIESRRRSAEANQEERDIRKRARLVNEQRAEPSDDDHEYCQLEEAGHWCTREERDAGDKKELDGLFSLPVMTPTSWDQVPQGTRCIKSRFTRRWKEVFGGKPFVKSRLVIQDFRTGPVPGGELYAATPTLMTLRWQLTLASWYMNESPGEQHVAYILDVTQAFPHAFLDDDD